MAATDKLDAYGQRVGVIDPKETQRSNITLPGDAEQKKLRALVSRRHPEYQEKSEHWEFLEETYEGGRDWFEKNIFQYVKEGPTEFTERKKRAYRFNHTREVVDLVNKYLFRQHINRNEADAPEGVREFWKKSTRNGLGVADLSRQLSKMSSIGGRVAIVVDSTAPSNVTTVADAKAAGVTVYSYMVGPRQILDFSKDDQGDLNWILIEEAYRPDDNPFEEAPPTGVRWRLWTKNDWMLVEERKEGRRTKLVIADQGEHGLGEVPVVLHDNIITDEEWASSALIDEIAYLDRAVANYLSNLDAIIQDQTFSQLAMPAQGLMPGEDNYNKMLDMGTKRIFLYDGEGGAVPAYISPDVKQAQLIVSAISKIINEIYHTVGLAGERTKEDNSVGIDNSSGVAKAYDFERVNALLAAKADALELTENKIARLVAKWHGAKGLSKDLVGYPDNFDTRGLYDEFDIAARLILVEAPEGVRREQMKAIIQKLFPMASQALLDALEKELEDWPADPIEQAAELAEATATATAKAQGLTPTQSAPEGKDRAKAKKNNRQGQVTKDTK